MKRITDFGGATFFELRQDNPHCQWMTLKLVYQIDESWVFPIHL